MPQLNPEFFISQAFWLVCIFALIYLFVAKFFLPRIGFIVEGRANQIKKDIAQSEKLINEYKDMRNDTEQLLVSTRHEAFTMIDVASKKAEAEIHKQIAAIEKTINTDAAKADARLSRFKAELLKDVSAIAKDLQADILEKMHSKELPIKSKNSRS